VTRPPLILNTPAENSLFHFWKTGSLPYLKWYVGGFRKGTKIGRNHSSWLSLFNTKMSFHFPRVFPLISDWSVWHNGEHLRPASRGICMRPLYQLWSYSAKRTGTYNVRFAGWVPRLTKFPTLLLHQLRLMYFNRKKQLYRLYGFLAISVCSAMSHCIFLNIVVRYAIKSRCEATDMNWIEHWVSPFRLFNAV